MLKTVTPTSSPWLVGFLVAVLGVLLAHVAGAGGSPLGPTRQVQVLEGDGRGGMVLVTFDVPRSFTTRPGSGAYTLTLAAAGSKPSRWYQVEADPAVPGGCRADAGTRVPPYGRIASTFPHGVIYAVFTRPLEGAMLFVPAGASCVEFSLDYHEGAKVIQPALLTFARWFASTVRTRRER